MNNCFINKKVILYTAVLFGAASLSGCGKASDEEKALASFSSSISDFTDYIQDADEKINNLDVNKQESASELLEILDEMDAEFARFAQIDPPDQYESVSGLASMASEAMSNAVSYYHTAYEADPFDENYANAAYQYYSNSMEAVNIIGYLLAGEKIPENDHITVYEETNDSHILDKWLSGDKNNKDSENNETSSEWVSEDVD